MTIRCHSRSGCIAPATQRIVDDDEEWAFCDAHWNEIETDLLRMSVTARELREHGVDERMVERIVDAMAEGRRAS